MNVFACLLLWMSGCCKIVFVTYVICLQPSDVNQNKPRAGKRKATVGVIERERHTTECMHAASSDTAPTLLNIVHVKLCQVCQILSFLYVYTPTAFTL